MTDVHSNQTLWSISRLAEEFELDHRTVKKRIKDIPSDGDTNQGHPGWYLSSVTTLNSENNNSTK